MTDDIPSTYTPFRDAEDAEDLAMEIEDAKEGARAAANDATRALLNEDVPVTDDAVEELWGYADRLSTLARSMSHHVPEERRSEAVEAE